jgi:alkylation response protein AidB-like acyl-CoA dehydrogenase
VAKHKGLTMFLVPLDDAGVEIRELKTLGGQRTNVTYYSDVRLPDSARVGEINGGWKIMTIGLDVERTVPVGPAAMLTRFVHWAADHQDSTGHPLLAQDQIRHKLARGAIEGEVSTLLFRRSVWAAGQDGLAGVEGSMTKLYGSETYNALFASLLDALGPEGLLSGEQPMSINAGQVEHGFRYGPYYQIAGGVSEVQREIIAQRGLGLPRSR